MYRKLLVMGNDNRYVNPHLYDQYPIHKQAAIS